MLTATLTFTSVRPARQAPVLRLVGGTTVAMPAAAPTVTVAQFCAARGLDLDMRGMQRMGVAAAKYSRLEGLKIDRATDELFGEVNAYDVAVLEAIAAVMFPATTVAA